MPLSGFADYGPDDIIPICEERSGGAMRSNTQWSFGHQQDWSHRGVWVNHVDVEPSRRLPRAIADQLSMLGSTTVIPGYRFI